MVPGWGTWGQPLTATPTVKDRYTYAYGHASNRLYRKNELQPDLGELYHANGSTNGYDGLDRLTDFRRGTLSASVQDGPLDTVATVSRIQEWTLDPVGNWSAFKSSGATTQPWDLDQSRAHNKANEIEDTVNQPPDDISGTPNWVDPNYDDAGNMTCGPKPGDETTKASLQLYKYDAWNRLTEVYTDADEYGDMDPGELVATYSYDGQHRRIEKVLGDPEDPDAKYDYYYNENWQVVEVHKDGEDDYPLEQYVWGAQYIDAPVVRFRDHTDGQGGGPDGTVDDTLYYTYDAQFNVTALVTPAGAVAERYAYDPYGQVTTYDPDWTVDDTGDWDNEILYCGYRWDPETGLYHVRNRYYHPTLGRWTTRDPIGYGDGMNLYEYVRSRPIDSADPSGLLRGVARWYVSGRLERLRTKHLGYVYFSPSGMDTMFDRAFSALHNIDSLSHGTLGPSYGHRLNDINIPFDTAVTDELVLHEVVHAYDDAQDIYLDSILPSIAQMEATEGLAYGAQYLTMQAILLGRNMEDTIDRGLVKDCQTARNIWYDTWRSMDSALRKSDVTYFGYGFGGTRKLNDSDLQRVFAALGFKMSCSTLRPFYEKMLADRGIRGAWISREARQVPELMSSIVGGALDDECPCTLPCPEVQLMLR